MCNFTHLQLTALCRTKRAWDLAVKLGDKKAFKVLGMQALELLDIELAIRCFRQLHDVAMVYALEKVRHLEDKHLLAGHISLLNEQYSQVSGRAPCVVCLMSLFLNCHQTRTTYTHTLSLSDLKSAAVTSSASCVFLTFAVLSLYMHSHIHIHSLSLSLQAQNLFLSSSQPSAALDMRKNLLQWDHALKLAKKHRRDEIPLICREYAAQLEVKGDYEGG
jgi:hypothetical protein